MDTIADRTKAVHIQGNAFKGSVEGDHCCLLLAVQHLHCIIRIRPQSVQVRYHPVSGHPAFSIDAQGIGLQGVVQTAVLQLKGGTSA